MLQYSGSVTVAVEVTGCSMGCTLSWRTLEIPLTPSPLGYTAELPLEAVDSAGSDPVRVRLGALSSDSLDFVVRPSPARTRHFFPNGNNMAGEALIHLHNPTPLPAHVTVNWFVDSSSSLAPLTVDVAPRSVAFVRTNMETPVAGSAFGADVQSDRPVGASMRTYYGATALAYLGSTPDTAAQMAGPPPNFDGSLILQFINTNEQAATVTVRSTLLPAMPVTNMYPLAPRSRLTAILPRNVVWADSSSTLPVVASASSRNTLEAYAGMAEGPAVTDAWIPGGVSRLGPGARSQTVVQVFNPGILPASVMVTSMGSAGETSTADAVVLPGQQGLVNPAPGPEAFLMRVTASVPVHAQAFVTRFQNASTKLDGCTLRPMQPARDLLLLGGSNMNTSTVVVSNPGAAPALVRLQFRAASAPDPAALAVMVPPGQQWAVLGTDSATGVPNNNGFSVEIQASVPVLAHLTREWSDGAYFCLNALTPP